MYTEPELSQQVARLAEIFLESYPDKRDDIETFVRWVYSQYGYTYSSLK